ncbi:hypothetical protein K438DRAFT_1841489 [Mycena galopus ATCC 62051]|nr:hypothetical protein K438DRAFT_1841489 [Mycena galopus ATCC 62051]
MAVSTLTETPLFTQNYWSSQPLADNSWINLPNDTLGSEHSQFLAALKQLNTIGCPDPRSYTVDPDFCIALGIPIDPTLAQNAGNNTTNYTSGRALAWTYLLHYQVLDLLLAVKLPRQIHRPFAKATVSQWSQPTITLLRKLSQWDTDLARMNATLGRGSAPPSSITDPAPPPADHPAESLGLAMQFSDIRDEAQKILAFKNIQAMATGLVWILELGTEHAPVLAGGKLAIAPLADVGHRYARSRVNDLDKARLERLGPSARLLRSLSYIINISSTLAVIETDLQSIHIDLIAQQEIHHLLAESKGAVSALPYIEHCVHTIIRATCAKGQSAAQVTTAELAALCAEMPPVLTPDRNIFTSLIELYTNISEHGKLLQVVTPVHQSPGAPTAPAATRQNFTFPKIHLPVSRSLRPIARSLSMAPTVPLPLQANHNDDQMKIFSEVPGFKLAPFREIDVRAPPSEPAERNPQHLLRTLPAQECPPAGSALAVDNVLNAQGIGSALAVDDVPNAQEIEVTSPDGDRDGEDQIPPTNTDQSDFEIASTDEPSKQDQIPSTKADQSDENSRQYSLSLSDSEMDIDEPVPPSEPRRSGRLKNTIVAAAKQPASYVDNVVRKPIKRRSSPSASQPQRGNKKSKAETETQTALDSEIPDSLVDPDQPPILDPHMRFQRCVTPEVISAVLPNGKTQRRFAYFAHSNTQKTEYQLIWDVQKSAAKLSDTSLHFLTLAEWEEMADSDRIALWATGCDIYIHGLRAGQPIRNLNQLRSELTKCNTMDTPIQVQVQGLREFPDNDDSDGVDYTADIRTTTLDTMLEHAKDPNGLVLNALGLPGGHFIHQNPLIDSGFDLETKAYCKTNGLPDFELKFPPYEEMYFKLLGLSNTLSLFHIDITMTWIYIRGPGEKFWIRSRPQDGCGSDDISDAHSFETWEPDRASVKTHDYEVTALPAGSGIFLQQAGRRHAVIGTDTGDEPHAATLTIGGYFLCASRIRSAIGVIMHIVMLPHLLTNAEHVSLWQIYIRISMFWLHITEDRPHEQDDLKGYLPNLSLSTACGWLDIIYLACMVELLPCLDHRNYGGPGTPECEVREASAVRTKYAKWRKWLTQTYSCHKIGGKELRWERDIFSPCLLNMALALSQYHSRVALTQPTADIFNHFTHSAFQSKLRTALGAYNVALVAEFDLKIYQSQRRNFFAFNGNDLTISVV